MTQPHILHALAALASLRQARAWLDDAPTAEAQPGLRRTAAPRELTARAAGRVNRLLQLERAERTVTDIPSPSHPVPIRPAVLDAQTDVHDTAVHAAWIVASALRRRPLLVVHHTARRLSGDPWAAAVLQLHAGVPWLQCDCPILEWWGGRARDAGNVHRGGCLDVVARDVAQQLAGADARARLVLGVGPAWVPLGLPCEVCGRRTVEAEVTSPDERDWIVRCGNGCWIKPIQEHPRARTIAVLKSIRRHQERTTKRERIAA